MTSPVARGTDASPHAAHLRGDVASHGYGHGSFTAWSSEGALLATGSQTVSVTHLFDREDDPQIDERRRSITSARP